MLYNTQVMKYWTKKQIISYYKKIIRYEDIDYESKRDFSGYTKKQLIASFRKMLKYNSIYK